MCVFLQHCLCLVRCIHGGGAALSSRVTDWDGEFVNPNFWGSDSLWLRRLSERWVGWWGQLGGKARGEGGGWPLWSLWSPCCGFSTFGWQTSVLCMSPLWCGGMMMSKQTYDEVGMRVVSRALPDTWPYGNWEAGFTREFGIYITQRFTGQTFLQSN